MKKEIANQNAPDHGHNPLAGNGSHTKPLVDHAPGNKSPRHGQTLLHRVEERKAALLKSMTRLQALPANDPAYTGVTAIEEALAAVKTLLTGDLKDINPITAEQLATWLDTSKYLPEQATNPQGNPPSGGNKANA